MVVDSPPVESLLDPASDRAGAGGVLGIRGVLGVLGIRGVLGVRGVRGVLGVLGSLVLPGVIGGLAPLGVPNVLGCIRDIVGGQRNAKQLVKRLDRYFWPNFDLLVAFQFGALVAEKYYADKKRAPRTVLTIDCCHVLHTFYRDMATRQLVTLLIETRR